MAEQHNDRVHPESVVLDIGQDIGALIIYTAAELRGREIEVSPPGSAATRVHVEVLERRVNGRQVFAAVFPKLRAGGYEIWGNATNPSGTTTIVGGEVTTVDWRQCPVPEISISFVASHNAKLLAHKEGQGDTQWA